MFAKPLIPVTVIAQGKRKPEHRTVEQPRFYIQPTWHSRNQRKESRK